MTNYSYNIHVTEDSGKMVKISRIPVSYKVGCCSHCSQKHPEKGHIKDFS